MFLVKIIVFSCYIYKHAQIAYSFPVYAVTPLKSSKIGGDPVTLTFSEGNLEIISDKSSESRQNIYLIQESEDNQLKMSPHCVTTSNSSRRSCICFQEQQLVSSKQGLAFFSTKYTNA